MITLKRENKFYHLTFNGNRYIAHSLDIIFAKIEELKSQSWQEILDDKIRLNSI